MGDKAEMAFGGSYVSVIFDSGCSIASYLFKDDFFELGKEKVKKQSKGTNKVLRMPVQVII